MKTYCIYLGRGTMDPVAQTYMTVACNLWTWQFFAEMLRELVTTIDTSFAGQFFTKDGNCYVTFSADEKMADVMVGMLYSALGYSFPNLELKQIPDFTDEIDPKEMEIASTEFYQSRNCALPINTGADFKTDCLAPLVGAINEYAPEDQIVVQAIIQPLKDTAILHSKMASYRSWEHLTHPFEVKYWFKRDAVKKIHERMAAKSTQVMYKATLRLVAYRRCEQNEKVRREMRKHLKECLASMVRGYGQLSDPDLNILKPSPVVYGERALKPLRERKFGRVMLLSHEEMSSLWHPTDGFPTCINLASHAAVPAEAPHDPDDKNCSIFARSNYRNVNMEFGLSRPDLRRHLYIIGKSGTGKSSMMQLLIQNDMKAGHGLAVIDPHGDLIDRLLCLVPKERVNDIIILDPADTDFPASFNPMAWVPEKLRVQVALGIVEIFHKLLGGNWNDHLEMFIRYIACALLSTHDATLLSVEKMITDESYRIFVAGNVADEGIRKFWLHDYEGWSELHFDDAITPLRDVLRQFLATDMIRNIVAQPVNKFDFRSIIDSNKILFVKVSKGLLGNENATLFGSLVVSKIYQAAMSRADIPEDKRKDFYFYIDEFQTFAAENVKEMLAESRKYHLNLILAHQFLGQLPDNVVKTLFGNVGSLVSFCLSGEDANTISAELSGSFDQVSLTNLPTREFYVRMMVNDKAIRPFSGRTIDVVYPEKNYIEECISVSRSLYAVPLSQAQEIIVRWEKGDNMLTRIESLGEPKMDLRQHLRRYGTVLQLSDLDITDEHLLQLSHTAFDNVKELSLTNTKITDTGIVSIANLRNLVSLNLDGTKITDAGLKALTMLPRLKRLRLDRTRITDDGVMALKSSHVRELVLRETMLTDKALKHLAEFRDLTEVALEHTAVSKKGVDKLRSLMPDLNVHF